MNIIGLTRELRVEWRFLIVAIALIFTGAAQAKIDLNKLERQNWAQVTTDHFTVFSDQGEKAAFKLARKLEMFRKAYGLLGTVALKQDARPLKVISVKHSATYDMLKANREHLQETAGFFADTLSGNYAVVNARHLDSASTARKTATSILFHEYTHYLEANLSSHNLPYWYSEGFADYLSQIKFSNKTTIKLGLPIKYHLNGLNSMQWTPMEEILKASHNSYQRAEDLYRIYSQSWLMVHYMKSDSSRNKQLRQYLSMVWQGSSVDEAFQQSFGMSYTDLDNVLQKYMRLSRHHYTKWEFKKPFALENYSTTKLAPQDILFELGEVLLNGLSAHNQAQLLFERTIKISPLHASALAGLATIHMSADLEKADVLIDRAKTAELDNAWISTVAGHINSRYAKNSESPKQHERYWDRALSDYQHAIDASDTNIEALSSAASLYISTRRWQEARQLVEFARQFAPSNLALRQQLIIVYMAMGDSEAAELVLQRVRRNHHMSAATLLSFEQWLNDVKGQLSAGSLN